MSKVVSLAEHRQRSFAFTTDPAYNPFPPMNDPGYIVHEKPVAFAIDDSYIEIPEYKFVYRQPDGDFSKEPIVLSCVGKGYNVIQNNELFAAIEANLLKSLSREELEGVEVRTRYAFLGRDIVREYIFPSIKCDVGDDRATFRMKFHNSHGAGSFRELIGAIVFACDNGLIIGDYERFARRHTSGLTIPSIVEDVERGIKLFLRYHEIFKKWRGITLTDDKVAQFFEACVQQGYMSKRRSEQLLSWYIAHESKTRGRNVWGLFNALTYYASHNDSNFPIRDTGKDNEPVVLLNREKEVARWTNSKEFQALAA